MSSEKKRLLWEERAMPDDLDFDRNRRHHTNDESSPIEAERELTDRHLENCTHSRFILTYHFMLHLVCLLLGVSLFFTITVTSRNHRDLAMLGT